MKVQDLSTKEKLMLVCGKGFWATNDLDGKIPSVTVSDGPVGVRKVARDENGKEYDLPSVAYPALHCLANSWDRESAREMGECLADDCKEKGVDVLLAPGVNIKRNPLCGRNFEYFSEDPFLAGSLAREYIDGLQKSGVGACLKHFCANSLEYNRLEQSSDVDERTLREIYLKPFEIACKAKPVSAMCSYNRVNGVYASENAKGFKILREEFGFDGAIMSDWGAVRDRARSLLAGLDLEMPFSQQNFDKLVKDFEEGRIPESALNECAERILELVERCRAMREGKKVVRSLDERLAVARKIAEEGIVLLKNEGVLPLEKGKSVAVCGEFAAPPNYGRISGGGSAMVQWIGPKFNLADKLREKLGGDVRFERAFWEKGIESFGQKTYKAFYNAAMCDVSIICVGTGAEFEYEGGDRESLKLSSWQENLILQLAERNPNTVVIVFAGGAIDMSAWKDRVQGIVLAGFCGESGGDALARILTGEVNPSGKLAETQPLSISETSSYGQYNTPCVARYGEGLDVGYRYYDRHGTNVAYPFGFGLSYSAFEYIDLAWKEEKDGLTVCFKIKNISERDGKEVSQLYVRPLDPFVYRPDKELKGFSKDEIAAGKSKTVRIALDFSAFAYYSVATDGWRVDDGLYEILIGASSRDIRLKKIVEIKDGAIVNR